MFTTLTPKTRSSLVISAILTMANQVYAESQTSTVQESRITVDNSAEKIKYSPMIFGQFIEHFDNQIYGGIYDPESELSDEDGFRIDVLEALKEIKVPIVRWPGGCFVSTYHWLDGVEPDRTQALTRYKRNNINLKIINPTQANETSISMCDIADIAFLRPWR